MTDAADAPAVIAPGAQDLAAAARWRPYQIYVLVLLTAIVFLNYLDRGVLSIIQEPIKQTLKLTDWQLGLLTGPAFSIFYAVAGVPSARLAERFNRSTLIAVSLAIWSAATAFCGAATTFAHLALCRLGVGMGEGGTAPVTYSLLAESFSVKQRGLVMSVVSAGMPIAAIVTPLLVAVVAQTFGWRAAFVAVGLPGLAVALLIRLTLKEPRHAPGADPNAHKPASFLADARFLLSSPTYVLLFFGAAFTGVGIASMAFRVSFLVRTQHISLAAAGGVLSVAGVFGLVGTYFGGWLADRLADARGRSYCYLPGITGILTFVLTAASFMTPSLGAVAALTAISTFVYNMKDGPNYAAVQNVVLPRMRATAAAVYMIAATVIGSAGPVLVGAISDFAAGRRFRGYRLSFAKACPGGHAAPGAAHDLAQACAAASAHGVRTALIILSVAFALGGLFFLLASRTTNYVEGSEPAA